MERWISNRFRVVVLSALCGAAFCLQAQEESDSSAESDSEQDTLAPVPVAELEAVVNAALDSSRPPDDSNPTEGTGDSADSAELADEEEEDQNRFEWDVHWDRGLHYSMKQDVIVPWRYGTAYQYEELKLSGKIGARFHVDGATYSEHSLDDVPGEVDLRRGRIYTRGQLLAGYPVDYKVEFGFVGGDFFFNDNFWWWKEIPYIGSIKLGHIKFPMSMERTESSRDLTFMERAAPVNALVPSFAFGVQFGGPVLEERMTWALGWFGGGDDDPELGSTTTSFTRTGMRVTGVPILEEEDEDGPRLLHLGLGFGHAFSFDDRLRVSARPESFFAPRYMDTGSFDADNASLVGVEVAAVRGAYSIQGEYFFTSVDSENFDRINYNGFYLYGSWFPTGEHRVYNKERGVFTEVVPRNPVTFKGGGWGALELGMRYSYLDLNDDEIRGEKAILGGRMHTIMTGVNWYLDRSVRVRLNYGLANVDSSREDGWIQILQGRLQIDF